MLVGLVVGSAAAGTSYTTYSPANAESAGKLEIVASTRSGATEFVIKAIQPALTCEAAG